MSQKRLNLLLFSIILSLLFSFFSVLIFFNKTFSFDLQVTYFFQSTVPRFFDLPFSLFSILGSAEVSGVIWFVLLIFTIYKRYFLAATSLFLLPFGVFIELLGKLIIVHLGPPHELYRGVLQLDLPSNYIGVRYAYPSGHVLRAAFLVTFLIILTYLTIRFKKTLIISSLSLVLILMIISRIYLGEHWVSDVVGGLLLGSSLGILSALTLPVRKV